MNKVAFYYRKDLNVTKHGEYKAGTALTMGDAVTINDATGEVTLASNSASFNGIVDIIRYNVQGNDSLAIEADERVRVGVGIDYEIVVKGNHDFSAITEGAEVAVTNGKFVAPTAGTNEAVGKVVKKFQSGEVVVRIY